MNSNIKGTKMSNKNKLRKGALVESVSGHTGRVFWIGIVGQSVRVGFTDSNGQKHFEDDTSIKVLEKRKGVK